MTPETQRSSPRWVAPIAIVAMAVLAQLTLPPLLGDYWARVAIDVGIAIVLAVSLNIVNGYTGQFSIGHAAFYAIGAFTAAAITYYGSILIWNHSAVYPWPGTSASWGPFLTQQSLFVGAMLMAGLVAAVAGWFVGLPSLRLRGDYLAIVTLGFGEIVRVLFLQTEKQLYSREEIREATFSQLWPPPVGGALGFINIPKVTTLFWTTLAVGICILFAWRLKRSTFGRAMIAIRENEIAAEAMGVNVTRLKVWAFVLAAFFAGVAGALYAHESGTQLGPIDAGFQRSFDIVIMVVLGGLGSISGAVLAATLLTIANEWLRDPTPIWHVGLAFVVLRLIVWPEHRLRGVITGLVVIAGIEGTRLAAEAAEISLGQYRMILYALVLVLMMILRPQGLFGMSEITDLFSRRKKHLAAHDGPEGVAS